MKNFVQPGKTITLPAPAGGVVNGSFVKVGSVVGVAAETALEGDLFDIEIGGVYDLPKVSAQAWAIGDVIYATPAGEMTTAPAGNVQVGVAVAIAANPSSSGRVRLNDISVLSGSGPVAGASAVVTSAAANVSEVAITVVDSAGKAVAGVHNIDVWLSDDAAGEGLTASTASGTVQAKAASGLVLSTYTAKKALRAQTLKTGVFTLEITDSAKTPFKVCAYIGGKTVVVATLAAASYGA